MKCTKICTKSILISSNKNKEVIFFNNLYIMSGSFMWIGFIYSRIYLTIMDYKP